MPRRGATRRRCARSARPSASPPRQPSTPTSATLQRMGYLRRDPTKPRAIEVRYDPASGAAVERRPVAPRAPGGRRGRRHRRAGPGERRGAPPPPGRLHRRRPAVHAAGPGRLDDRRRHPRRRLRGRPRQQTERQQGRHRRGRHPRRGGARSRPTPARATGSCWCPPTPASRPWSSTPPTSPSTARSSPSCAGSEPAPGRHRRRARGVTAAQQHAGHRPAARALRPAVVAGRCPAPVPAPCRRLRGAHGDRAPGASGDGRGRRRRRGGAGAVLVRRRATAGGRPGCCRSECGDRLRRRHRHRHGGRRPRPRPRSGDPGSRRRTGRDRARSTASAPRPAGSSLARSSATAPDTWGAAIDVPAAAT